MRRVVLVSCMILLGIMSCFAVQNSIPATEYQAITVSEIHEVADGKILHLQFAEVDWEETDSGDLIASYPMAGVLESEGLPVTPVLGRMIRLPARGGIEVEVIQSQYETYEDVPYDMNSSGSPLAMRGIDEDQFYPQSLCDVSDPAIFKDFRVAVLSLNPVQVMPGTGEVRVYTELQLQISYTDENALNELDQQPTQISETFLPFYRDFLDWNDDELDDYVLYRGGIQVVMVNDAALLQELQPWLEWKRQKGWTVDIVPQEDVPDWNPVEIRQELQNRYNQAEIKFDYVIIVGDGEGDFLVPAGNGDEQHFGDHNYGLLEGGDQLQEAITGRISVETTQELGVYVDKVLQYERDTNTIETDWYAQGAVAATASTSSIYVGRYVRRALYQIGYTQVDTAWHNDGIGEVVDRMQTSLNAGKSYYTCRGNHGMGLQTHHIEDLTNTNKLTFAVDLASGTGDWRDLYSVSEAYMRANRAGELIGGIGALGRASSMSTRFNNAAAGGAAYSVIVQRNPTMGQALMGGKMNVWNNFVVNDPQDAMDNNHGLNLMGDPSLWLYTDLPHEMEVEAPGTINYGNVEYTVSVVENGSPVADAWVTFYWTTIQNGGEPRNVTAKTSANGEATLYIPFESSENPPFSGTLTVTAQNFIPFQQDVQITRAPLGVTISDISFQDNGQNGTQGDGDGIPDAGETIGVSFNVTGAGFQMINGLQVTGNSDDPWVENVNGAIIFGNVNVNETVEGNGIMLLQIAPEVQDDWRLPLHLNFSSQQGLFNSDISIVANAPSYVQARTNPNFIAAGRLSRVQVEFLNIGKQDAGNVTVTIESLDPKLSIQTDNAFYPELPIGEPVLGTNFEVTPIAGITSGSSIPVVAYFSSEEGHIDTTHFQFIVGQRFETDPSGPDSYGYFAFEDIDQNVEFAPTFDWLEINPDADENDYDGIRLDIDDPDEDLDDALTIDLPFPVRFYGEVFNQIAVNSNGYIAMGGDQADMLAGRNWHIPSPLGPSYMIAPYWDERLVGPDSSGIYVYHDAENHRFIVEWYAVPDIHFINPNTFQIIIYDHVGEHTTWTGDNEFLFQYNQVDHSAGATWDVPFATVGIENGNQTDGVEISYWLSAAPGASEINAGRAIFWTTNLPATPYSFDLLGPENNSQFTTGPIQLSWEELEYENDGGSIEYEVEWSPDPRFMPSYTATTQETEYQLEGIVPGEPGFEDGIHVFWRVKAIDGHGFETTCSPVAGWSFNFDQNETLEIPLQGNYFELISINRVPQNLDAAAVFADIANLVIVYQENGDVLIPPFINTIGDLNLARGYKVFGTTNDQLTVEGQPLDPQTLIELESGRWNWVGYPFTFPVPVTTAFQPAYRSVIIVQRDDGAFWIPDVLNTIGEMEEGVGYRVFPSNSTAFEYNPGMVASSDQSIRMDIPEIADGPQPTGLPYLVMVKLSEELLEKGASIIELYDRSTLVGKGMVIDELEQTPVIAWEGSSEHEITGFESGSEISIRILGADGSKIPVMMRSDSPVHFGDGAYATLALELNDSSIPTAFEVGNAWPNPFNPTISVQYGLPDNGTVKIELFDLLGRSVFEESVNANAGQHLFQWHAGSDAVSGVYFLQIQWQQQTKTQKILLVK
ncbi:T9SS type A sorting domain-containing protein [bacterium]|nr:T9SS type A sorting domain-containing protein [bacterium]